MSPGKKNTIVKYRKKFKINATGFQGVNCSSILQITPNTRSFEFAKIFINIRLQNTEDSEAKDLLIKALLNPNLTDEKIISYLKKIRPNQKYTIEKVNDIYFDDEISYDEAIKKNNRYITQLNPSHGKKIEKQKNIRIEENLKQNDLKKLLTKEKRIHIVLDNYSVHHSGLIKNVAEILNINLIYLPKNSPELNPIEDVWRMIKKETSNKFIKSKKQLEEMYTSFFHKKVDDPSLYQNWLGEFITC
jgi:transposase